MCFYKGTDDGDERWKVLNARVVENNIQIEKYCKGLPPDIANETRKLVDAVEKTVNSSSTFVANNEKACLLLEGVKNDR